MLCEELIEPLFCWTPELVRGSRDLLGNGTDPGNSSRLVFGNGNGHVTDFQLLAPFHFLTPVIR